MGPQISTGAFHCQRCGRLAAWGTGNVPASYSDRTLTTIWLATSVRNHRNRRRARLPSRYCYVQAMPAPLSVSLREGHRRCGSRQSTRSLGAQALAGESPLLLLTAARRPAAETPELFLPCLLRVLLRASERCILRPLSCMRSSSSVCACSPSDFSSPKLNLCSQECAEIKVEISTNVKVWLSYFIPPFHEPYMIKYIYWSGCFHYQTLSTTKL